MFQKILAFLMAVLMAMPAISAPRMTPKTQKSKITQNIVRNATVSKTTAPVPYNVTSPGAINKVQIPTTQYVRDYLSTAGKLPDLKLENVSSFQIPTEKYIFSAIDHVNAENGNETHYADNASTGIPMDISYFLEQTEQKLETCPVPAWGDDVTAQPMSYVDADLEWKPASIPGGRGNWRSVTYGNGKFVAVAGSIAAYSTDGVNWTQTTLAASAQSVTYGDGKFVAVAGECGYNEDWYYTCTGYIAYSADGINWTQAPMPVYAQSITYGDGKFVAVAGDAYSDSNVAAYSSDGIEWNETSMPVSVGWRSVTWGNDTFVAIGGDNTAAYSMDGITWHPTSLPESYLWRSITYGNGKFVALSSSDEGAVSIDGITWEQITLPKSVEWDSITYGNGKFVAVGYDDWMGPVMAYSDDGEIWTIAVAPAVGLWTSVAYGDGKFVAVAYDSPINAVSIDGINWEVGDMSSAGYDMQLTSAAYGDGKTVVISKEGVAALSANGGKTWRNSFFGTLEFLEAEWTSVIYGNGRFVAIGRHYDSNIAAYSTDGVNWTQTTLSVSGDWRSLTYGDGKFIAVASECGYNEDWYYTCTGYIAYSADGINWTQAPMPVAAQSIAYGDGKFVAVGDSYEWDSDSESYIDISSVAVSIDGVTWIETRITPGYGDLGSVTYGDGKFVALIEDWYTNGPPRSFVAYSTDGITWTISSFPEDKDIEWDKIVYGGGTFVALTEYDRILAVSTDAVNWDFIKIPDGQCVGDNMIYGDNQFIIMGGDCRANVLLGNKTSVSNTNPWVVGNGCNVADGVIACDTPLVGGTATCENAKCSCVRQKLINNGEYVDNVAQTPVVINRKFADQNACNLQCANVCADNAVNNTDGAQKDILCGK